MSLFLIKKNKYVEHTDETAYWNSNNTKQIILFNGILNQLESHSRSFFNKNLSYYSKNIVNSSILVLLFF